MYASCRDAARWRRKDVVNVGYDVVQRQRRQDTILLTSIDDEIGNWPPEWEAVLQRNPKRPILARKDIVRLELFYRCDLCVWRRDKKALQGKEPYSGKLAVRRDHPRRYFRMQFGTVDVGLRAVVTRLKFHQNLSGGFRHVGGRNLSLAIANTKSCTTE